MRETVGEVIRKKYPNSTSMTGFLLAGIAFLAVPSVLSQIKFTFLGRFVSILGLILTSLFLLGLLLVFVYLLIVVLETLLLVIPSLQFLGAFVRFLVAILQLLKRAYLAVIKFFIATAVQELLVEKERGQKIDFVFQRQQYDDHYYPTNLNLNQESYVIVVEPDESADYWRIGLKFSKNGVFTSARFAADYPLFHLGQSKDSQKLHVTYYDQAGIKEYDDVLIANYSDDKFSIVVVGSEDEGCLVKVLDSSNNELKSQFIEKYSFCQLFAWGDGEDYKLHAEIYNRKSRTK